MLESLFQSSPIMPENIDKQPVRQNVFDPSMQTENIAFDAGEMVPCGGCKRPNPPNRLMCLYCGKDIELPPDLARQVRPDLRKLDAWERGFNIVLRQRSPDADIARAASFLSMEFDDLNRLVDTESRLPVARVESREQADLILAALGGMALDCTLVSDESLAEEKPNKRISGLEFLSDSIGFKDFNTGNNTRIPTEKIALIVTGVISKTKIDSLEKRRRRGESKVIDESAISADDVVLDIYLSENPIGFRLLPSGFDFSCLGDKKGLLARENWGRLLVQLKAFLPGVKVVDDYPRVRSALGTVWPVESRTETKGIVPSGFGKREFGSVASTSNLSQFNKYSRLQWHLL